MNAEHDTEGVEAARRWIIACKKFECGELLGGLTAGEHRALEFARALVALSSRVENAREEVIEECAKVADAWCEKNHWPDGAWGIAANIRSLKDKP